MSAKPIWTIVRAVSGGNGHEYHLGEFPNGKFVVSDVYAIVDGRKIGGTSLARGAFTSREDAHAAAMERVQEHRGKR